MSHEANSVPLAPYIPDALVETIAEEADTDVRSIWKRLGGGQLRPKLARRVDRAIAAHLKTNREPPRAA